MVKIREYQGEKDHLIKLIEELQDYLIEIDPLTRLRRLSQFGETYTNNLLHKIRDQKGIIFFAEQEHIPVGMVAGVIEEQSHDDTLECVPTKSGRVLELIVTEKYRGKNIGYSLIKEIESFFKNQGCDIIRIEVFTPNSAAREFYKKNGYHERRLDVVKVIN